MANDDPRNILYTLYDRGTLEIIRVGTAGNALSLNWRIGSNQGVILDIKADMITQKIAIVDGEPTIVNKTPEELGESS